MSAAATGTWRGVLALLAHMRRTAGGRLPLAFALLVVVGASESVSLLLIVPIVRLVQAGGGAIDTGALAGDVEAFGWLPNLAVPLEAVLVALVALVALQALAGCLKATVLTRVLCDFTNAVRLDLFRALAEARWSRILRTRTADAEHLLTGDVDRIQGAGFLLLAIAQTLVVTACYAVLALLVSVPMTLFAAGVGLALFAALAPFRRRSARFGEELTILRRHQYRAVADFLHSLKVAKAHNAEDRYATAMERTLLRTTDETLDHTRVSALGGALFQVASAVALVAFAWVAIAVLQLSLAQIVVLTVVFARLAPRALVIQTQLQQLLVALPAYRSVCEVTRDHADHAEPRGAVRAFPPLRRALVLDAVTYRHAGGEGALRDVDLVLPAGTVSVLVGPSGAGKSTLLDVAAGLLPPTRGQVLADGVPLDAGNARAWRERVSYVAQDVQFIHDTIAQNLLLARPDATVEDMRDALDLARALRFVDALPNGLDAVIGENGHRFSGGERQRIALARALLRRPDVLILDEGTSALDPENEAAIAQAVRGLKGRVTVLAATHSAEVAAIADQVLDVRNGRVAKAAAPRPLPERGVAA